MMMLASSHTSQGKAIEQIYKGSVGMLQQGLKIVIEKNGLSFFLLYNVLNFFFIYSKKTVNYLN